jgi:hypothetical protein
MIATLLLSMLFQSVRSIFYFDIYSSYRVTDAAVREGLLSEPNSTRCCNFYRHIEYLRKSLYEKKKISLSFLEYLRKYGIQAFPYEDPAGTSNFFVNIKLVKSSFFQFGTCMLAGNSMCYQCLFRMSYFQFKKDISRDDKLLADHLNFKMLVHFNRVHLIFSKIKDEYLLFCIETEGNYFIPAELNRKILYIPVKKVKNGSKFEIDYSRLGQLSSVFNPYITSVKRYHLIKSNDFIMEDDDIAMD